MAGDYPCVPQSKQAECSTCSFAFYQVVSFFVFLSFFFVPQVPILVCVCVCVCVCACACVCVCNSSEASKNQEQKKEYLVICFVMFGCLI